MNAQKMRRYAAQLDEARDKVKPVRCQFTITGLDMLEPNEVQAIVDQHRDELRAGNNVRVSLWDGPGFDRTVRIEVLEV